MNAFRPAMALIGLAAPLAVFAQQPDHSTDPASQAFVIERQHIVLRYNADGTGSQTLDVRVRIQSEAALQSFGQLSMSYSSANQDLRIDSVRVFKAGGGSVLAPASAVQDLNAPFTNEAPMYSDLRMKVVTVPALRPGDTLQYHVTWTVHTPVAAGQFWSRFDFSRGAIILDQRLALIAPAAKYVQVRTNGLAQPTVSDTGGQRTWAWRYTNLTVDTTAASAHPDSSASVQLTTFRNWAEVGAWYAGLERDREAVTPAIRARADSLVRGMTTLRDSIQAIYAFVSTEFRYVSLSFGLGRYQPHAAAEVLANQYGDCKDKHTLLAAMLQAIGIRSAPVLISSAMAVDSLVPSPGQFDHLISWVPARGDTLWMDATPEIAPFRYLLRPLRNKTALVIPLEGDARLMTTPDAPPFAEFFRSAAEGALDSLGRLVTTVRFTMRGDIEIVMRDLFTRMPGGREDAVAGQFGRQFGFRGTSSQLQTSAVRDTREPFWLGFRVDAGSLTWLGGQRAELPLPLLAIDIPEPDTASADSIEFFIPDATRSARIRLPAGMTPTLPSAVRLSKDFGEYHATYAFEDGAIVVERVLRFTQRAIPASRRAELASLRETVRNDERRSIAVTRSGPLAAAAARPGTTDTASLMEAAMESKRSGGDPRAALRGFRRVLALAPRHPRAWRELGYLHVAMGSHDSAAAALRRHLEITPSDFDARGTLGFALWRGGHHEEARAEFRELIEQRPLDAPALRALAELSLEMHRATEAVTIYRQLAAAESFWGNHLSLGRALLAAGDTAQGITEFETAVAMDPTPPIQNNVAYEMALSGVRLERAAEFARAAVETTEARLRGTSLTTTDKNQRDAMAGIANYWDTYGWVLYRQGQVERAEEYVRAAWLLAYHAEVGDHLGQILARRGKPREAQQAYVLALHTDNPLAATRTRLAALAGSRARADALSSGGRLRFQELRTVRLARTTAAEGSGEVEVLVAPGAQVVEVRFVSGPDRLTRTEPAIRAAVFPVAFPAGSTARIVKRGLLTCMPSGSCLIVLYDGRI